MPVAADRRSQGAGDNRQQQGAVSMHNTNSVSNGRSKEQRTKGGVWVIGRLRRNDFYYEE